MAQNYFLQHIMKIRLLLFACIAFSFSAIAQIKNKTVDWTQIKMNIPADRFVPRELFKINDTTMYLGCRYYLLNVSKDSLRVEFGDRDKDDKHVVRSVVSYDGVVYVSSQSNSVLYKSADSTWMNLLGTRTAKGNINWEMVEYKSQLYYTSWPRWIEVYDFKTKTWASSSMLDQRGAGYIAGFEKTKNDLFVSLYGGGVFKKDPTKDDWINCNKGLPDNLNVRRILSVKNKIMFAATEEGVFYSKLKKFHWKPCIQTQGIGTKYVGLMYHNKTLYAIGTNGELMISRDLGKKWTTIKINNSEGYVLYSIEAMGEDLYLSADGQGKKPSGVFLIPISHLTSFKYSKGTIVSFQ